MRNPHISEQHNTPDRCRHHAALHSVRFCVFMLRLTCCKLPQRSGMTARLGQAMSLSFPGCGRNLETAKIRSSELHLRPNDAVHCQ